MMKKILTLLCIGLAGISPSLIAGTARPTSGAPGTGAGVGTRAATSEAAPVSYADRMREPILAKVEPQVFVPSLPRFTRATAKVTTVKTGQSQGKAVGSGKYPWRNQIVTTVFWVGEQPSQNNPVPNTMSCWDKNWTRNYGGFDNPKPSARKGYLPAKFVPGQNPFYIALPYNDMTMKGHKAEASRVIPWFNQAYTSPTESVLKGRWVAIRKGNRVCYAQWEDVGPFQTDHWEYVFGNERPRANLNRGAGLDVSPAVRDFLGMDDTDVTDWKFVDFEEVPRGPWATVGENNTFVQRDRDQREARAETIAGSATVRVN